MIALPAVLRLAWRRTQQTGEKFQLEGRKEKRSVKQKPAALSALGVPGEFKIVTGEIGVSGGDHRLAEQRFAGGLVTFHDEAVGFGDGGGRADQVEWKDEGIVEAAGALEDRAAAAAPAQDRDPQRITAIEVNLVRQACGVADDDERNGGFPEAENPGPAVGLAFLQHGLFPSEVGCRRRQR